MLIFVKSHSIDKAVINEPGITFLSWLSQILKVEHALTL